MPVRRCLLFFVALGLTAILWALPAPSPAQGQYEGYEVVIVVANTYTVQLTNQTEAEPGLYTYTGKTVYPAGDMTHESHTAAVWYPAKKVLTLAVLNKDGDTVTCSFDEVLGTSFTGSYFYLNNTSETKKVSAVIDKGNLP